MIVIFSVDFTDVVSFVADAFDNTDNATAPAGGFYRATACNATHGITVAILSVCPSDACIVTKLNDALRIFWYHTKRQSL